MVLTGGAKTVYQREYMRWRRGAVIPGECEACKAGSYIQAHHEDYTKPTEVKWLCAACHKKVHMIKAGKRRKGSNPYKNPLDKIKPADTPELDDTPTEIEYIDADGSPVYRE